MAPHGTTAGQRKALTLLDQGRHSLCWTKGGAHSVGPRTSLTLLSQCRRSLCWAKVGAHSVLCWVNVGAHSVGPRSALTLLGQGRRSLCWTKVVAHSVGPRLARTLLGQGRCTLCWAKVGAHAAGRSVRCKRAKTVVRINGRAVAEVNAVQLRESRVGTQSPSVSCCRGGAPFCRLCGLRPCQTRQECTYWYGRLGM